ncbi:class C sortase [Enemella sp. A6]|uniref:class C sortase n=1 Tax=Enemella sp. A6 TaxID=3440152 RepID=UPI003EBAFC4D
MTTTETAPKTQRPTRHWPHRLVPVVLILLGVAVMLYPIGATFYNNYRQQEFARQYQQQLQRTPQAELDQQLEAARAYNAQLDPKAYQDPWDGKPAGDGPEYQQYLTQLNEHDAMARIRIPTIGVDLPVRHGTSEETLASAVGHLFGTSLPVGGPGTHAGLTGHTGIQNASLFDGLIDVAEGDVFYIDVYGETLAYQVNKIQVVLPDRIDTLAPVAGQDLVTLITCTPYGVNSHRLLVQGTRIPYDPAADPSQGSALLQSIQILPWMYARLIGAAIALALLLAMIAGWIGSDLKNRRRAR